MRITVVGQGYAGLTASVGLAAAGHTVIGIERDVGRLRLLESGASPLYEPGLQDVLTQVVSEERLTFASTMAEVPPPIDAVVIAVGSPPLP
ncbi:MAG TPA: UDP-glucose/GDP-mannose dehydrogenase family protein, partial [Actinomycetota bacterium]|nr:UDP-glucose/GDP-mannose dehydrogenase family protein [Actinomycetota bacterium]